MNVLHFLFNSKTTRIDIVRDREAKKLRKISLLFVEGTQQTKWKGNELLCPSYQSKQTPSFLQVSASYPCFYIYDRLKSYWARSVPVWPATTKDVVRLCFFFFWAVSWLHNTWIVVNTKGRKKFDCRLFILVTRLWKSDSYLEYY